MTCRCGDCRHRGHYHRPGARPARCSKAAPIAPSSTHRTDRPSRTNPVDRGQPEAGPVNPSRSPCDAFLGFSAMASHTRFRTVPSRASRSAPEPEHSFRKRAGHRRLPDPGGQVPDPIAVHRRHLAITAPEHAGCAFEQGARHCPRTHGSKDSLHCRIIARCTPNRRASSKAVEGPLRHAQGSDCRSDLRPVSPLKACVSIQVSGST